MSGHLRRQLAALHDEDGPVVTRGLCEELRVSVRVRDRVGLRDSPSLTLTLTATLTLAACARSRLMWWSAMRSGASSVELMRHHCPSSLRRHSQCACLLVRVRLRVRLRGRVRVRVAQAQPVRVPVG